MDFGRHKTNFEAFGFFQLVCGVHTIDCFLFSHILMNIYLVQSVKNIQRLGLTVCS